jgi:hypothetical protein
MIKTLARDHPMSICEVLQGYGTGEQLEALLRPFGYRYYLLTSEGPSPRDRIEGHPHWLNFLLTTMSPEDVARL